MITFHFAIFFRTLVDDASFVLDSLILYGKLPLLLRTLSRQAHERASDVADWR